MTAGPDSRHVRAFIVLLDIVPNILSVVFVGFLIAPPEVGAQTAAAKDRLRATATRLPSGAAIRLDGRLDEPVWRTGPPLTEFVQKEPNEGAPPTERMEVRFVYDDGALFVGARMYSRTGAAGIQAPLGRRDEVEQAEYVLIALDTYLDRRTAYCFGVTASGSASITIIQPIPSRLPMQGSIRSGRREPGSMGKDGPRNCGFRFRSFVSMSRRNRPGD